jgi:hypothetical protein
MQNMYLSPGYYEDGNALFEALKFAQDIGVNFSFNRASSRLSLNFRSTGSYAMRMSDNLQSFMRFEDLPNCQKSFSAVGERDFDANRGLNLMYVYCDVATHSIVGYTKTPLLRVCNVVGKHGEYVRHTYSSPTTCPWGGTTSTRSRLPYITTRVNPCRFSTASRWSPYTFDADMDDHFYLTLPSNDVKLPE